MSKRDSFFLSFSYLPNRNFIPSFQERTKGIGIWKNNVSPILDYSAPSEIYVRFEFYISSSSTSPKITFQQGMKFLVKSKVKHLRVSGEATCNNLKIRMDGTSMPCVKTILIHRYHICVTSSTVPSIDSSSSFGTA